MRISGQFPEKFTSAWRSGAIVQQRSSKANEFGKATLAHFPIEMNLRASCLAFELCGKFWDGSKSVTIFLLVSVPSHDVFWKAVKDGGDSHSTIHEWLKDMRNQTETQRNLLRP